MATGGGLPRRTAIGIFEPCRIFTRRRRKAPQFRRIVRYGAGRLALMEPTCRVLRSGDAADVAAVQRVLQGAPGYHLLIEGKPPSVTAAADLFAELPPCKAQADKQILGFFVGSELAGCADLVRGYPSRDVAYLGLLILADHFRGQGHGTAALAHVTQVAHSWGCRHLRLAVIATNEHGHHFWMRQGFVELYRKQMPACTGEAIVMQRALGTSARS